MPNTSCVEKGAQLIGNSSGFWRLIPKPPPRPIAKTNPDMICVKEERDPETAAGCSIPT